MKVLILGATGYIGLPTAQAFIRAGHEVYGQTRDENKMRLLESEEIVPVVADPAVADQWSSIAEKVDVVIDCIGGFEIRNLNPLVFKTAVAAAQRGRANRLPKLTYIALSGTWLYGDSHSALCSERFSPDSSKSPLVSAWRPAFEQEVIAEPTVDGIVVRPSILYGRSGSVIVGSLFREAEKAGRERGVFEYPVRDTERWALVHVDDLADLIVRVSEASPICKGLIFDASKEYSESMHDIYNAVVSVSDASGYKCREPANPFEEAWGVTTLLRPNLAWSLVGWKPRKPSLVDGMKTYYAAYKALARL